MANYVQKPYKTWERDNIVVTKLAEYIYMLSGDGVPPLIHQFREKNKRYAIAAQMPDMVRQVLMPDLADKKALNGLRDELKSAWDRLHDLCDHPKKYKEYNWTLNQEVYGHSGVALLYGSKDGGKTFPVKYRLPGEESEGIMGKLKIRKKKSGGEESDVAAMGQDGNIIAFEDFHRIT